MRYVLSTAAEEDLIEAFAFGLESFGLKQAEAYRADIKQVFDLIARFPQIARERAEFSPPVRLHHHGRHYTAYMTDKDQVLIVRIIHEAADLHDLFGE